MQVLQDREGLTALAGLLWLVVAANGPWHCHCESHLLQLIQMSLNEHCAFLSVPYIKQTQGRATWQPLTGQMDSAGRGLIQPITEPTKAGRQLHVQCLWRMAGQLGCRSDRRR